MEQRSISMYTLYISQDEQIIKVAKAHKSLQSLAYTEDVVRYNDCYFLCKERKPLVAQARIIQQQWIAELEEALRTVQAIKI